MIRNTLNELYENYADKTVYENGLNPYVAIVRGLPNTCKTAFAQQICHDGCKCKTCVQLGEWINIDYLDYFADEDGIVPEGEINYDYLDQSYAQMLWRLRKALKNNQRVCISGIFESASRLSWLYGICKETIKHYPQFMVPVFTMNHSIARVWHGKKRILLYKNWHSVEGKFSKNYKPRFSIEILNQFVCDWEPINGENLVNPIFSDGEHVGNHIVWDARYE